MRQGLVRAVSTFGTFVQIEKMYLLGADNLGGKMFSTRKKIRTRYSIFSVDTTLSPRTEVR